MEREPTVVVRRSPYEEPYHTRLSILVSNGAFSGTLGIYCAVDELQSIGLALMAFPSKVPDEFVLEYGSENPVDRFAYYLKIRAYTTSRGGVSALQFAMNSNREAPHDGRCQFSIEELSPAEIARLGSLLVRLQAHSSGCFRWCPRGEDEFQTES